VYHPTLKSEANEHRTNSIRKYLYNTYQTLSLLKIQNYVIYNNDKWGIGQNKSNKIPIQTGVFTWHGYLKSNTEQKINLFDSSAFPECHHWINYDSAILGISLPSGTTITSNKALLDLILKIKEKASENDPDFYNNVRQQDLSIYYQFQKPDIIFQTHFTDVYSVYEIWYGLYIKPSYFYEQELTTGYTIDKLHLHIPKGECHPYQNSDWAKITKCYQYKITYPNKYDPSLKESKYVQAYLYEFDNPTYILYQNAMLKSSTTGFLLIGDEIPSWPDHFPDPHWGSKDDFVDTHNGLYQAYVGEIIYDKISDETGKETEYNFTPLISQANIMPWFMDNNDESLHGAAYEKSYAWKSRVLFSANELEELRQNILNENKTTFDIILDLSKNDLYV